MILQRRIWIRRMRYLVEFVDKTLVPDEAFKDFSEAGEKAYWAVAVWEVRLG